jgi:hypothetical protein
LAALLPLAMPAPSKKKLPAVLMREVISPLCEGRWLAGGGRNCHLGRTRRGEASVPILDGNGS